MTFTPSDQFTPVRDSAPPLDSSKAASEAVQGFKPLVNKAAPQSDSLPKSIDLGSSSDLHRLYGSGNADNHSGLATDVPGAAKNAAGEKSAAPSGDVHHLENTAAGGNKNAEVAQHHAQPASQHEQQYPVKQGDTLSQIAKDHLPKGASTQEIYQYAKEIQQRNGIDDPRHLQAGSQIVLPEHHPAHQTKKDSTHDSQTENPNSNTHHKNQQQNQQPGKPHPSQQKHPHEGHHKHPKHHKQKPDVPPPAPSGPPDSSPSSDNSNPSPVTPGDQSPTNQKQQPTDQSPTPKQPTDQSPTPKQPTDQSPTPKQPTDQSPTPKQPTDQSPTPKQPTDQSPTPKQPTDQSPTPKQPTDQSPIPKQPTDQSPTPKQPTDQSPTPKQPTDQSPTPKQPTDQSPTPKQPTDQSPTPKQPTDQSPTDKKTDQKPLTTDQKPLDQHPTDDKKSDTETGKHTDSTDKKTEAKDHKRDSTDDKTDKKDDQPVGTVEQEQKKLEENANNKIKDPVERKKFLDHAQQMQDDAAKRHLSQEEIAKTYHEVNRLLTADGTAAQQKDKTQLAEQVMEKAANPKKVEQGTHNTCGAAALESRTFQQTPSAAAKMVADVAINGKYTASDGTTVKGDQVEHKNHGRDHADEIFQTTAINLHFQKQGEGNHYSVSGDKNNPAGYEHVTDKKGTVCDFKGMTSQEVGELSNMITGKNEKDVVLTRNNLDPPSKDGSATNVDSEKELQQKIKEQTDQGKTPIIWVDSNAQPYLNDNGSGQAGGRDDAGHFVRVSDYHDGNPPTVDIDNQWGDKSDHNGVPLHDVYEGMNPSEKGRAEELEKDAKDARAAGHPDHAKELQAIQAHQEGGDYKNEKLHREAIEKEMRQIQQDWKDNPPEDQERQDTVENLDHIIDNLKYTWSQQHERALEHKLLGAA